MSVTFNHIGHCVADVDRSRRFYEELLEFEYDRELTSGGELTSKLLRIPAPVSLRAVYLKRDGFVLELLHYPEPGLAPARERRMNEPGLTHISVTVGDVQGVLDRTPQCGGEVLEETNLGLAVMIKDPDGQLIEILANPPGTNVSH